MKTLNSLLLSALLVLAFSCSTDDENVIEQGDKSAYEGEEYTESMFEAVESITFSAVDYAEANSSGRVTIYDDPEIACAEITFEGSMEGGYVKVDFGSGCEGPDGRVRKGIVEVNYAGFWLQQGSTITTNLTDFYIDELKVEGTSKLKNMAATLSRIVYTEKIIGGKVTWPDNTFLTRTSDRENTIVFGSSFEDYVLEVEGTASGTTREGIAYEAKTLEPLVFKSSCMISFIYLPVQGIKTINTPDRKEITVNYGSGDCDNLINVAVGKYSSIVTIKQ